MSFLRKHAKEHSTSTTTTERLYVDEETITAMIAKDLGLSIDDVGIEYDTRDYGCFNGAHIIIIKHS